MLAIRWLVVIALGAIIAILLIDPAGPSSTQRRLPTRSDACFMSQKFVRDALKAPTTAKFPMWTEENCRVTRDGEFWRVRSFVDAQNGFGAMIRSDYGVEMTHNLNTDTWTVHEIMIIPR